MCKNTDKAKKFYLSRCNFNNKIVIVTGGSRGIGAQIAKEFASGGAKIILADISEKQMQNTATELESIGTICSTAQVDVTDWGAVERMINRCVSEFGQIDILVNNAGTIHPADFFSMTEADWDFLQAVDLKGVVACSKAVAPHMIKRKYGKIVNISSMAAFGVYMPGFSSYSAAKAAVNDFTRTTARELGRYGINVNAVAPGEIMTDLTFQDQSKEAVEIKLERSKAMSMIGRIGMPEDVANLVCFLASDCASFITGEVINIDGGRTDRM